MKNLFRHALRMSVMAGLVALSSSAIAQGRSRDVPPGIAKKGSCPPGLAKQGRCYDSRYDRDGRYDRDDRYGRIDDLRGSDWCWDRNHDSRCDVSADTRRSGVYYDERLGVYRDDRGNIYDRNGRLIGRMNDRSGTVYDRDGRVVSSGRDDIRSTVGDLIQRAQEMSRTRR